MDGKFVASMVLDHLQHGDPGDPSAIDWQDLAMTHYTHISLLESTSAVELNSLDVLYFGNCLTRAAAWPSGHLHINNNIEISANLSR